MILKGPKNVQWPPSTRIMLVKVNYMCMIAQIGILVKRGGLDPNFWPKAFPHLLSFASLFCWVVWGWLLGGSAPLSKCAQFLHPYWGRGRSLFAAVATRSTFQYNHSLSLSFKTHRLWYAFFSHFLTFFGNNFLQFHPFFTQKTPKLKDSVRSRYGAYKIIQN